MSRHVRSDAPRPGSLVAIALVTGLVGYGVAHASLDVDRAALAARSSSAALGSEASAEPDALAAAATPSPSVPASAGVPDAPPDTADDVAVEAAPAGDSSAAGADGDRAAETPYPSPPTPATVPAPSGIAPSAPVGTVAGGAGAPHVETGRVAYIRCEGLPSPTDVCPRDLGVERRVWDAVQALERCPAARGLVGEADLRVVFDGGRFSGIGFRELARDALDTNAIRDCLEGRLRELRTTHPATRYTASFRFSLVP